MRKKSKILKKCTAFLVAGGITLGYFHAINVNAAPLETPADYNSIVSQAGNFEMKQLGENLRAGASAQVMTPVPEETEGTIYYIDPSGDDSNTGTSPNAPWKTIGKVNETTFQAGDMVLFEAGSIWELTEPLHPLGSGEDGNPIVIGAYGEGDKPYFSAKLVAEDPNRQWQYGDITKHSSDALYFEDQQYIEIRDLEITNQPDGYTGGDSKEQQNLRDDRRGIHVVGTVTEEKKELKGFYLHDLYIHNVIGDAMTATKWDSSKRVGGIVFEIILKDEVTGLPIIKDALSNTDLEGLEPTFFSDILIDENLLMDNGYTSIAFKQLKKWGFRPNNDGTKAPQYYYTEAQGWYPHRNVTIQNNYLDHDKYELGANTIYLTSTKESVVQYNYSIGAGTSAIELNQSDNIAVQYNEIYGARKKATGTDSNAIDPDRSSTNALIQYNYINNCGDGILLCGFNYGSSVVRYNVIQNSASDKRYVNIHGSKGHNYIYNNIFYNSTSKSATFIASSGGSSYLADKDNHHYIYNNVFYSPKATARLDDGISLNYSNNSYLGVNAVPSEDTKAVLGNPGFTEIDSISGGTGQDVNLTGLNLNVSSPLINAGKITEKDQQGNHTNTIIPVDGGESIKDFAGNPVTTADSVDNGVYEFMAADSTQGGLNGYIYDLYGNLKANASVKITVSGQEYTVVSDEYGFYSSFGFPAGEVAEVIVSADDYAASTPVSIAIPAGNILRQNINLGVSTLSWGTVSGKITNVQDVTITLADSSGNTIGSGTAGSNGIYTLNEITVGTGYTVTFSKTGYYDEVIEDVEVKPGYNTVLADIRMKTLPGDLSFIFKENFDYKVGDFTSNDTWNVITEDGKAEIVEGANGNKILKISKTTDVVASSINIWNKIPIGATEHFTVSARIMRTANNGNGLSRFAIFSGETINDVGSISKPMADFGFYQPKYLFVDDQNSSPIQVKYACSFNTWYDIRLDVDMDTDTFDFYIDNQLKKKNVAFRFTGDMLNYFTIFGGRDNVGDLWVDYLWVQKGAPDNTTVDIKEIKVDELPAAEFVYDANTQTFSTSAVISSEQDTVRVRVSLENSLGKVTVNGTNLGYVDDNEYVEVSLNTGENIIPIIVTASDLNGTAESLNYSLKLIKEDGDLLAHLTRLELSNITFAPAFTGAIPETDAVHYDGGTTNQAEHTLIYQAVNDGCSVNIVFNGISVTPEQLGKIPLTLREGENLIEISVISKAGDQFQTYTIAVDYQAPVADEQVSTEDSINLSEEEETEFLTETETAMEFDGGDEIDLAPSENDMESEAITE